MIIDNDYYKHIIRAKFKGICKIKSRNSRAIEKEIFFMLSALLRLTKIRATDWKNLNTAEQIQTELDFTKVLLDFLSFNNRHCSHSLKLGLRELEPEELEGEGQ